MTYSVAATLQEAVKLLGAICLIPPDGHEKTLEAITIAAEMKGGERLVWKSGIQESCHAESRIDIMVMIS